MAIVLTHELLNLILKTPPLAQKYKPRTWLAFCLAIDCALEYPTVFIHLPAFHNAPSRGLSSSLPTLSDVFLQVSLFMMIEYVCRLLIPSYGPPEGKQEYASAAALGAEFVEPRLTIMVAVPLIEKMSMELPVNELHAVSVLGWLVTRQLLWGSRV